MAVSEWFLRQTLARIAADAKAPVSEPRSQRARADLFKRVIAQIEREQQAAQVALPALRNMLRDVEEEDRLHGQSLKPEPEDTP